MINDLRMFRKLAYKNIVYIMNIYDIYFCNLLNFLATIARNYNKSQVLQYIVECSRQESKTQRWVDFLVVEFWFCGEDSQSCYSFMRHPVYKNRKIQILFQFISLQKKALHASLLTNNKN